MIFLSPNNSGFIVAQNKFTISWTGFYLLHIILKLFCHCKSAEILDDKSWVVNKAPRLEYFELFVLTESRGCLRASWNWLRQNSKEELEGMPCWTDKSKRWCQSQIAPVSHSSPWAFSVMTWSNWSSCFWRILSYSHWLSWGPPLCFLKFEEAEFNGGSGNALFRRMIPSHC